MDFLRLRLAGFKSFVDATELVIAPGLTGVVGPNGCGKSNLVEALRWVMGETSARRMRGDEMDDVIFGGTARRPSRNLAEVTLVLGNPDRTAPAAFNDSGELEVTRRIERGAGSDYRINGRPQRARDVQLLFADNASGANSPALVSQGRVGALIAARPQERRSLLEEAAGITGLHSRRHEAELRLKAAETNLVRLDDVLTAMEGQLQGLKKQARQAARYRSLSESIRRTEAILWHQRWKAVESAETQARTAFAAAEDDVRALMLSVAALTTRRTDAAAALPGLRQTEATAAAALQRLLLAREALDADERRVADARQALLRRLDHAEADLAREQSLAFDAGEALARLEDERLHLLSAQEDEALEREAAEEALLEARDAVDAQDRALTRLTEQVAADEARRTGLTRQRQELEQRHADLVRKVAGQVQQRDALAAETAAQTDVAEAEAAAELAEERLDQARMAADAAEQARHQADAGVARAREASQGGENTRGRIQAEVRALSQLLTAGSGSGDLFPPLIDAVTVTPGYEVAFAAALRDDLSAPLDEAAAVHWRTLIPYPAGEVPLSPALAPPVQPLATLVQGPPALLARALARMGVVPDIATGQRLAPGLGPGEVLVTRDGAAWRWDGFTVAAGAPTAAAVRLQQRNRLEELREVLAAAEERAESLRRDLDAARHKAEDAAATERRARDAARDAFTRAGAARDAHTRLVRETAATASRLAALTEGVTRLEGELADTTLRRDEVQTALDALPSAGPARQDMAERRADLAESRTRLAERQSRLDRLTRESQTRRQRLAALEAEERSWRGRQQGAGGRLAEMEARVAATREELAALAARPAEIADQRQALLGQLAEAERRRRAAADALAQAESDLARVEKELKQTESRLSDAREARARAEAAVANALQNAAALAERVAERLACQPHEALAAAGLAPGEDMPDPAALEARLERLIRERENMGPVNLRAEMESAELETQMTTLQNERADLTAAIGRLRHAISGLNREARERLTAAFEAVNAQFRDLFIRMFGGGSAHLELTGAEDPLEAGLEIYASPPGKRLQILSLLSGGEQALTALSLIFAVFLSNPAPICVLDEVDAPLDEANVGRFCDMLHEMATSGRTRFLVVTHHRLTMARVDRLYGVTMAEQGISQLVSVDLRAAQALRAAG